MISKEILLSRIKESLVIFADIDRKEHIWIKGEHKYSTYWDEALCRLFDDNHLDNLIDNGSTRLGLSKELTIQLEDLRNMLMKVDNIDGDIRQKLDSPDWQHLALISNRIVKTIEAELG